MNESEIDKILVEVKKLEKKGVFKNGGYTIKEDDFVHLDEEFDEERDQILNSYI